LAAGARKTIKPKTSNFVSRFFPLYLITLSTPAHKLPMAHFSISHAGGNAGKPTLVELQVGINRPGCICQRQEFAAFFFDRDRLPADLE
jgi:hypothetical protein